MLFQENASKLKQNFGLAYVSFTHIPYFLVIGTCKEVKNLMNENREISRQKLKMSIWMGQKNDSQVQTE